MKLNLLGFVSYFSAKNEQTSKKQNKKKFLIVACTCNITGTKNGNQCAHDANGQCDCKPTVGGQNCQQCLDNYYGFGMDPKVGCLSMH